jgi:hypothetical protein
VEGASVTGHVDLYAAELRELLGTQVLAGEPRENVELVLETAHAQLGDDVPACVVERFFVAILERKAQIERTARLQQRDADDFEQPKFFERRLQ